MAPLPQAPPTPPPPLLPAYILIDSESSLARSLRGLGIGPPWPFVIVMVLAVVAARELFAAEATANLRDEAVAALFWMSNWLFVAQHTDYFSHGAPPSPLQHTWSLAVEEQYYLLWPLMVTAVVAGLAALAYRRGTPLTPRALRTAARGGGGEAGGSRSRMHLPTNTARVATRAQHTISTCAEAVRPLDLC